MRGAAVPVSWSTSCRSPRPATAHRTSTPGRPEGGRSPPGAVPEDRVLEGLGDREADLLASRDVDRLTRLRVPPHPCLHLPQTEDPEPRDLHRLTLLHG